MAFQNQAVSMKSGNVVGAKGAAQSPPQAVKSVSHYGVQNISGAITPGAQRTPAHLRSSQSARSVSQYRMKPSSGRSGRMRGLGTTSAMVDGTLTFGSAVIPATTMRRNVTQIPRGPVARPVTGLLAASGPTMGPTPTGYYWVGSGSQAGQPCDPQSLLEIQGLTCEKTSSPPSSGPAPWGGNPPGWGGGGWGGPPGGPGGGSYGWSSSTGWSSSGGNPDNPTSQDNLAQLVLQYQSNPSSLTQTQWQQLQAAGVIPSTVPYSNAALVNPQASGAGAIDPATGIPYSQELAAATAAATPAATTTSSIFGTDATNGATTIFGIDWYYVVGGGVLAYALLFNKGGRR
jgi:hypothetical protein